MSNSVGPARGTEGEMIKKGVYQAFVSRAP